MNYPEILDALRGFIAREFYGLTREDWQPLTGFCHGRCYRRPSCHRQAAAPPRLVRRWLRLAKIFRPHEPTANPGWTMLPVVSGRRFWLSVVLPEAGVRKRRCGQEKILRGGHGFLRNPAKEVGAADESMASANAPDAALMTGHNQIKA